jgi:hypothetical protein
VRGGGLPLCNTGENGRSFPLYEFTVMRTSPADGAPQRPVSTPGHDIMMS